MIPLLSIRGLKKQFGGKTLLDIEELTINPASAYMLTGPNGAGKSTLLRVLCGLEPAEVAQASFHGNPVQLSPYPKFLRNAIVYVHQHPVMFSASVAANIAYGLRIRGIETSHIDQRVNEAMEWAGVSHLSDRLADRLSGGEKQRVALARARILKPELLLLDEPTSNLDKEASSQITALIPTLIKEGSSIVMASHDDDLIGQPDVIRLALQDGHIGFR